MNEALFKFFCDANPRGLSPPLARLLWALPTVRSRAQPQLVLPAVAAAPTPAARCRHRGACTSCSCELPAHGASSLHQPPARQPRPLAAVPPRQPLWTPTTTVLAARSPAYPRIAASAGLQSKLPPLQMEAAAYPPIGGRREAVAASLPLNRNRSITAERALVLFGCRPS